MEFYHYLSVVFAKVKGPGIYSEAEIMPKNNKDTPYLFKTQGQRDAAINAWVAALGSKP